MVTIRMARHGAKRAPFYRIVAADSRNPRDGRFLEIVGHYNPVDSKKQLTLKNDRIQHWLDRGAQPSDAVRRLLKRNAAEAAAE
jgi:small subunit ribosomal protein S16